ncbi:SusC/RagA family TonB-linked outer membrane protein [Dyadobacter sp. CY356]|uniref:SusC/RagA family TonB-linked outer membrane protein n=1 Tax=Dyadobacter sp. CY356 TaxID=2906442 RepID=UPI001F2D70E3|nr:SusC/RagA family TonB-linked outer membrane protein [Dyadobacter sp. CY356]MCF0055088.1 SusC/RagA family TonB-linked outer membrane protein [Dyadobacter sp. CY356]
MKISFIAIMISIAMLLSGVIFRAHAQSTIEGMVISLSDSTILPGAVIKIKGRQVGVNADAAGRFSLPIEVFPSDIIVSYIGFTSTEVHLEGPPAGRFIIGLAVDVNQLAEVVVSTGYQNIPRERATGSFSSVNTSLLNRRVSTDILSRIDDVVPGLITNKGKGNALGLLIRGQSTINSSTQPLIIIDNFPYEGDLGTLNPNDVESVTVLKDAAAASIWGSRAGNGVIVITTKKGGTNRPPHISFNSNLTISEKPNLFYQPRMSSSDYIESEKLMFTKGRYTSAEKNANKYPFTPVIELLIAARDKNITQQQADAQMDVLKTQDIRNDYEKYFYQNGATQQYSLALTGGTEKQRYNFSAGYDNRIAVETGNRYQRYTISAGNTFQLSKRLDLTTNIYYAQSKNVENNPGPLTYTNAITGYTGAPMYPYAQIADQNGNALAIINTNRASFTEASQNKGLLNWQYKPLDELRLADNNTGLTDYRINAVLNYKLLPGLGFGVLYQYGRGITSGSKYQSQQTYYTRNLINRYTSISSAGVLTRPIPLGGIMDRSGSEYTNQNLRGQFDYNKSWKLHELSAIAGMELRDLQRQAETRRIYGYEDEYATSKAVDYISSFTSFINPAASLKIPYLDTQSASTDRYLSYYVNGAYSFKQRYTVSASGRIDQSNLFGVKTNARGVPLYSVGTAWNLSQEPFYHLSWLPALKLRATLGYAGNSNKNVSAYTTASFGSRGDAGTGATYASIQNPPNPSLRWERIKTFNLGLDFESRGRVITGTVEYYHKTGIDLIGQMPYPGSSGVKTFTGNYASTSGHGMDVTLSAKILDKNFKWHSQLLFSQVIDKVKSYAVVSTAAYYLGSGDGGLTIPLEGKPLYSVYSLPWAGLEASTGDPQGYLGKEVSKDYAAMLQIDPSAMTYHGTARPKYFGSIRNTFSWKALSLSVLFNYRLAYFFRENSVSYTQVYQGIVTHGDYSRRWQKPGDERSTNVPSMPNQINYNRESFYALSADRVKKADHLRLQDINLSYTLLRPSASRLPFRTMQLYMYASNLGIVWKSYKGKLDPDYAQASFAPVRNLSLGIKMDL